MLTPEELGQLHPLIVSAVEAALAPYMLGRKHGSRKPLDTDPESDWRAQATRRYALGSWKRDVLELTPFRVFRPSELYNGTAAEKLRAAHPNHSALPSAIANTLNELIRDGWLLKIGTGLYAPSIDAIPIVPDAA